MQRFTLDKSITIEKNVGQLNTYGHKATDNWELITNTRARVLYITGQNTTQAEQQIDINTFDFLVRYRKAYLENEIRIVYANNIYEVFQIEDLDRSFQRIRAKKKGIAVLINFLLESGDQFITENEENLKLEKAY